jgi:hypothetical protein
MICAVILFALSMVANAQERFLYSLLDLSRVIVQKDIAYRQDEGNPLRFDIYRLPEREKPAVVIGCDGDKWLW